MGSSPDPTPPRQQRTTSTRKPEGSIAAPVDKAAVLAMVDQLAADDQETQKQMILAIAHSENIICWTAAITHWMQAAPDCPVSRLQIARSRSLN